MTGSDPFLRPDEQELLQEIMNIAFGQAAADLAQMVDMFVVLSIPQVCLIDASELPVFLASTVEVEGRISMVEQEFWGQFKGSGYLVLPSASARELVAVLGNTDLEGNSGLPLKDLEMETLLEVGNILIGACVGKVAQLLEDTVTYCPPRVAQEFVKGEALPLNMWEPGTTAIVLKTLFRFSGRNVSGFLFLVTSQDSLEWLRKALASFLGRYA